MDALRRYRGECEGEVSGALKAKAVHGALKPHAVDTSPFRGAHTLPIHQHT